MAPFEIYNRVTVYRLTFKERMRVLFGRKIHVDSTIYVDKPVEVVKDTKTDVWFASISLHRKKVSEKSLHTVPVGGCQLVDTMDGGRAIICGVKRDHECDDKKSVLLLRDGNRVEATEANRVLYLNHISGESCACSICGRASIDDVPYM